MHSIKGTCREEGLYKYIKEKGENEGKNDATRSSTKPKPKDSAGLQRY